MNTFSISQKLYSLLLCTILLFSFSSFTSYADEKSMGLNKNLFSRWEIMTFEFSGVEELDWLGVYPRGTLPGTGTPSTLWEYATEGTHDLHLGGRLAAGEYTAYFLENDGYTVLDSYDFEIVDTDFALDSDIYHPGDIVAARYTYSGNSKDWVGLYKRGTQPESGNPALLWAYVSEDGVTSLELKVEVFAVGQYTAFYCSNDGYTIVDSFPFEITEKVITKPDAPKSISYIRDECASVGRADGVVTVLPSDIRSEGALLFWGDDNGPLSDYNYFGYATYNPALAKYSYSITKGNLIPAEATHIVAYGINGNHFEYILGKAILSDTFISVPINCEKLQTCEPLYSFEVISDLHVTADGDWENTYFGRSNNDRTFSAFSDIAANQPNSTAIIVVGDLVNYGKMSEYEKLYSIIQNANVQTPIYYTIGNHEFYDNYASQEQDGFDTSWELFRSVAGWDSSDGYYRYKIINGDYYIFMGTEGFLPGVDTAYGYYSEQQRTWLAALLEQAKAKGANAFVFMHQSIENTVSGSFLNRGQAWSGINNDEEMRAVIESYENTFLFTGHSHWNLNSYGPFINGDATSASYFNTASTGYLWCDNDVIVPGSEGLHVDVYSDCVIVRGRDFQNNKWIPNVYVHVNKKQEACASVGNTLYPTLTSALQNSKNGDTVKLLSDCAVSDDVILPEGVTLEMSDFSVNGGNIILYGDSMVTSNHSIYGKLKAQTLISESVSNGSYTYIPSPYHNTFIANNGVQIRTEGAPGLRFIARISAEISQCGLSDYGFIVVPQSHGDGNNTTLHSDKVKVVSSALRGSGFNIFENTDTSFSYTACITGIVNENKKFIARPYFKYSANGTEYTVYAEHNTKYVLSVNDVKDALSAS